MLLNIGKLPHNIKSRGNPTLMFFSQGDKVEPITYQGQRTAEDMVSWLNSQKVGPVKV